MQLSERPRRWFLQYCRDIADDVRLNGLKGRYNMMFSDNDDITGAYSY